MKMVEVEIECPFCKSKFLTYQIINTGAFTRISCSDECQKEYFSIENIRERKLEIILNDGNSQ